MGVREAWEEEPGRHLAGSSIPSLPKPACYTISPDSLPSPGEPPYSSCGQSRHLGNDRLQPVPLKGTCTLHTCQAQENAPQNVYHRKEKGV